MGSQESSRIGTYPGDWQRRIDRLPPQLTVNVAGYSVTVPVTRSELTGVYLPILNLLWMESAGKRRVVAGLAGIPGSGKSTLAAVLELLADMLLGMGRLVVVGIDGWHWPNAVLDTRTTTDEDGRSTPLRTRKGSPESFDVEALAAAVVDLHRPDRPISLPVYDRRLHDPVPDRLRIGPGTGIVLLEGNYLLSVAPGWKRVSSQIHPKFFLHCEPKVARQRVIDRHVRGGLSLEEASRKYESNDQLNTMVVLDTAACADYTARFVPAPVVERAAGDR